MAGRKYKRDSRGRFAGGSGGNSGSIKRSVIGMSPRQKRSLARGAVQLGTTALVTGAVLSGRSRGRKKMRTMGF